MKRILLLCAVIGMLTGCASMKRNVAAEVKNLDFPPLNEVTTVAVGEEMMIQGTQISGKALNVKQAVDGFNYDIPAGKYVVVGEDEKKYYFNPGQTKKLSLADPVDGLYVSKDNLNKICVITKYGTTYCYDTIAEMGTITSTSADHIQRTLIYSGKHGDNVDFMYSERSGLNTIMTHNVSYNLKENQTIGYRGARIKLINCTNEDITYQVISNFPVRDKR